MLQYGIPATAAHGRIRGCALAYSVQTSTPGASSEDRRRAGLPAIAHTLHVKLTGAMVLVLILDGIAYLVAVNDRSLPRTILSSFQCLRTFSPPSRYSPSASVSRSRHDHLFGDRGEQGRQAPHFGDVRQFSRSLISFADHDPFDQAAGELLGAALALDRLSIKRMREATASAFFSVDLDDSRRLTTSSATSSATNFLRRRAAARAGGWARSSSPESAVMNASSAARRQDRHG